MAASDGRAAASAAALARAAAACRSSFSRQHCLYLRPEPQWQGWLRPGRARVGAVIEKSVPYHLTASSNVGTMTTWNEVSSALVN